MESYELIKLPDALSFFVNLELSSRFGIDKYNEYNSSSEFLFTKDELSKIEELIIPITKQSFLDGIEKLPNLKSLKIENEYNNAFLPSNEIISISNEDVRCIEQCKNLESLSIINQPNITDIDLSGMPKLSKLNITNNVNLENISGIDHLKSLGSLTCVGNKSLQDIDGLDQAIIQNKDNLSELNLDVLLFPKAIKFNPSNGHYNQEAMNAVEYIDGEVAGSNTLAFTGDKIDRKVTWSEYLDTGNITIGTHSMLKMHNTACKILSDNCKRCANAQDTIIAIEQYLAENVTYDHNSLKHNRTKTALTSTKQNGVAVQISHKGGINGAYDCLVHGSCVCEGYTRGEQYLLALKGIKSYSVACLADSSYEYHSIIRIDGYYSLYSDPCWNAAHYQQGDKTLPYSLLTKEEISKDHMLSFEERAITGSVQTMSRSKISESIEYNTLFRNSRASEVAAQRGVLQQNVIGIVRTADGKSY